MTDPRVLRTRRALREGLRSLMQTRSIEVITVTEIASAASINRATFYQHFADKQALLSATSAQDLSAQLGDRIVSLCEERAWDLATLGRLQECLACRSLSYLRAWSYEDLPTGKGLAEAARARQHRALMALTSRPAPARSSPMQLACN